MNYNLSIPDIYNYNEKEKKILYNNFNIKLISTTLLPDTYYSLSEKGKVTNNLELCDLNDDFYYDNIYAFYFKTNTNNIIFYINNCKIFVHNNLLFFNVTNKRTKNSSENSSENSYEIISKSDIDQYIEIYIIYKNNYSVKLISWRTIFYSKNNYPKLSIIYDLYKYDAPYNNSLQTYYMMTNFYVKTKNNNIDNLVKFESNDIIFYFTYNLKSKITNTQYLYKYNLVKLEKKNTNIEYICQLNNLQLNNISSVIEYFENIDYIYDKIYDILNPPKNIYEYYLLDFKSFMIKNNIDDMYFTKITYDI
jgi:hypothetical protein